jgi:hypothetical protein
MGMGTNYYLSLPKDDSLASMMVERIHIAKLSAGWRANFQSYGVDSERFPYASANDRFHISNVVEVKALIERALSEGWEFIDEYGTVQDAAEFWKIVEFKQGERSHAEGDIDWGNERKLATYLSFLSDDGYDFSYGDFS